MKLVFSFSLCVAGTLLALFATRAVASAAPETCTVTAGSTIAFGSFDVFSTPTVVTGSIVGSCKKGSGTLSPIVITLSNGNNLQANGNRAMGCTTCTGIYASDLLQYQIYTDASLATPWIGATSVPTANPCPCGPGNTTQPWGPVTMYAKIATPVPGGVNDSSVGSYSDSITITINY